MQQFTLHFFVYKHPTLLSWAWNENTISVPFPVLAYKQISPESSCAEAAAAIAAEITKRCAESAIKCWIGRPQFTKSNNSEGGQALEREGPIRPD